MRDQRNDERARERERDPFTRPCIERLYSRLGFDTLELMISSSTGINSFSLLRAKYKPRLKERFNLIIFPVFFFGPAPLSSNSITVALRKRQFSPVSDSEGANGRADR